MISAILVDNHTIERKGITSLFENDDEIKFIAECTTGAECIDLINKEKPDVIVSDSDLADMYGYELYTEIKKIDSKVKFVVLTENANISNLIKSFDLRIDGYILKTITKDNFKKTIINVISGQQCYESDLLPLINKKLLERDIHQELLDRLTKRERQMLICVANGLSNKEIAAECHISERTVKNHLSSVFQKIEVVDRTQAAVFAIKTNLVQI